MGKDVLCFLEPEMCESVRCQLSDVCCRPAADLCTCSCGVQTAGKAALVALTTHAVSCMPLPPPALAHTPSHHTPSHTITHSHNRYSKEWEVTVRRLGRWIDFENDYKTLDPQFMESVW